MISKDKITEIITELKDQEKKWTSSPEAQAIYKQYHRYRFEKTLALCKKCCPNQEALVLDVGRSEFTSRLKSFFKNTYSMGFEILEDDGGHREGEGLKDIKHIVFDLNESDQPQKYPDYENTFDLIVLGETIEHLHIAAEYSLLLFKYLLKPGGKLLVTTPNAVTLKNRIKLLLGKNPYEKIRYYSKNPGHFREYTIKEIRMMALDVKFKIVDCYTINFYNKTGFKSILTAPLFWHPNFKDSLVAIFQK